MLINSLFDTMRTKINKKAHVNNAVLCTLAFNHVEFDECFP
jgi:hypothetical protein